MTDDGMYITVDDQSIPVEAVHHDEKGYYLPAEGLIPKWWYCAFCGKQHPENWKYCPKKERGR